MALHRQDRGRGNHQDGRQRYTSVYRSPHRDGVDTDWYENTLFMLGNVQWSPVFLAGDVAIASTLVQTTALLTVP